jgi:DNA repair protein RadC
MYKNIQIDVPMIKEATDKKLFTPADAVALCEEVKNMAQECLIVITLNVKMRVIDKHIVSLGTLNSSVVHPRDVFYACVADHASSFVCVHNHPSGDHYPSTEDLLVTKKLVEAGKIMSISIVDHVVIGGEGYTSMRQAGLVNFE